MFLLVVQVLQLEMQSVDLLASLGSGLFGVAHTKDGISVLTAELSQQGEEDLLLLGGGQDSSWIWRSSVGMVSGFNKAEQLLALGQRLSTGARARAAIDSSVTISLIAMSGDS